MWAATFLLCIQYISGKRKKKKGGRGEDYILCKYLCLLGLNFFSHEHERVFQKRNKGSSDTILTNELLLSELLLLERIQPFNINS